MLLPKMWTAGVFTVQGAVLFRRLVAQMGRAGIYICVHMHICICICTYAYTHMHICVQSKGVYSG